MNRPVLLWSPGPESTRVMVTSGEQLLLKARLSPGPIHPRAAQWLMEAIALWEGAPVRAVISAAAGSGTYARHFWDAVGMDLGGALYDLRLSACEPGPPPRRGPLDDLVPEVDGFGDLERAVVAEVLSTGGKP